MLSSPPVPMRPASQSRQAASHRCPQCSGLVHAAPVDHLQRVRCPSCLQVVVLVPSAVSAVEPVAVQAVRLLPSPRETETRGAKQVSRKEKETQALRLQKLEQRMTE